MSGVREFRVGFLACGLGAGALGFIRARASLGKRDRAHFVNVGGIDIDEEACRDFEYLTGGKAHRADLHEMTTADMRAIFGEVAPDCLFSSSPCKGFSRLLPKKQAELPKYQKLNELVLKGFFLACEAWDEPPGLLVIENVEGIQSRGAQLLIQLRSLLAGYGYAWHEAVHDCGEVGGLAQHRRRYLGVARLRRKVREYVYRPPRQRIKACGEVLETMPVPGISDDAGPLHKMPNLSWINLVRLSLIPAGKDWRALPKDAAELALKLSGANADNFKGRPGLMGVQDWERPARTVNGNMKVTGGNSTAAVADPRIPLGHSPRRNTFGVSSWDKPAKTVRGASSVRQAEAAVADPRPIAPPGVSRRGSYGVLDWDKPAKTVVGESYPSNGPGSIADPRAAEMLRGAERFGNCDNVSGWDQPVGTITHAPAPSSGAPAVADPRVIVGEPNWHHGHLKVQEWEKPARCVTSSNGAHNIADPRPADALLSPVPAGGDPHDYFVKYDVRPWNQPAHTVAGSGTNGGFGVADPRAAAARVPLTCKTLRNGAYGVMRWDEAARTVTGAGQVDNACVAIADPRKPPPMLIVIISEDGCWHRPITTLELAALQGMPIVVNGKPLMLAGKSVTRWRERIGNAVPVQAAQAIGESLLTALLATATGQWTLSNTGIWVERDTGKTEYDYEFIDEAA